MSFAFLDPGRLIDGELELVVPEMALVDEMLRSAHHPLTVREMPEEGHVTRAGIEQFLRASPGGRIEPDTLGDRAPGYHFWMRTADGHEAASPLTILGTVGLRISNSPNIELYFGHIGYKVFPAARGHRYAERATRLLLPLARAHGMTRLWITCNPDNLPSRRTCERLGAELVEIVPVPPKHPLYGRGDREKCRYRLDL